MEITIIKPKNTALSYDDGIDARSIRRIYPVVDKKGHPALCIEYMDEEFCTKSALFCDEATFENQTI